MSESKVCPVVTSVCVVTFTVLRVHLRVTHMTTTPYPEPASDNLSPNDETIARRNACCYMRKHARLQSAPVCTSNLARFRGITDCSLALLFCFALGNQVNSLVDDFYYGLQ